MLHPSRAKRCSIDLASGGSKVTVMVQGERLELPPLHLAARHDLPEMVQLLIKRAGASPNEADSKGGCARADPVWRARKVQGLQNNGLTEGLVKGKERVGGRKEGTSSKV